MLFLMCAAVMPGVFAQPRAMTMNAAKNLTGASEGGCRCIAYPDPATKGKPWTIGFGHTGKDVYPGLVITKEQGLQIFIKDLSKFVNYVNKQLEGYPILQKEFEAYVDQCFNTGYTLKGELLDMIKAGAKQLIRAKMNGFNHARINGILKEMKGLIIRCYKRTHWHEFGTVNS